MKKKNVKGVWVRENVNSKEKRKKKEKKKKRKERTKKRVKNNNKITNLGEVRHGFKKNEIDNEKKKLKDKP